MPITYLTPDDLWRLRTRRTAAGTAPVQPQTRPNPDDSADREALTREYARIGRICEACQASANSPSTDEITAAIIDDCPFVALCPGVRRDQIRRGVAVCPLKRFGGSGY